jgi:hypothetical protein
VDQLAAGTATVLDVDQAEQEALVDYYRKSKGSIFLVPVLIQFVPKIHFLH